jgi:hypothetical protein
MANRFDNGSVSAYKPQSFQELAFVPMMKRKQHDELEAAYINAKVNTDPLDVHKDEALRLKNEIEGKVSSLSEQLSTKGITPEARSSFLKFNKEYQDLISPTGRIGQINNAKKVYAEEFKEYLEDATKNKGFSREDALYNWQTQHHPKYTGYNDAREIKNIDSYGAPKRHILQEDLKLVKSLLGENTQTIMKNNGFSFGEGPNGSIIIQDGKGRLVETSNYPQLKEAQEYLTSRWIQPTGEGTISARFERQDPKRIIDEINNGLGMMKSYKLDDTRETDYSIQGYTAPEKNVDPTGVIISNDSTLTSDAVAQPTYTNALDEIKRLSSSKSRNSADQAKLEDLIELRQNADKKLNANPKYNELTKSYNNAQKAYEDYANKMGTFKDGKWQRDPNKKDPTTSNVAFKLSQLKVKADEINTQRSKIKDKAWAKSSSLRHNYSYMPSTPKEESNWNLHNENIFNVMKGVDLGNVLDLTSIHTASGSKKNIEDVDVQNIQELLKHGDPKSFKINNIKTYGNSKTPEITMTFNTTEKASGYDLKGTTGLFSSGDDNYGGANKPVTVTFKLKKLTNSPDTGSAVGYKNLSGAIADAWKDKGRINQVTGNFQGAEISTALISNSYADLTNDQLAQRASRDSDALTALYLRASKKGVTPKVLLQKYKNNKR